MKTGKILASMAATLALTACGLAPLKQPIVDVGFYPVHRFPAPGLVPIRAAGSAGDQTYYIPTQPLLSQADVTRIDMYSRGGRSNFFYYLNEAGTAKLYQLSHTSSGCRDLGRLGVVTGGRLVSFEETGLANWHELGTGTWMGYMEAQRVLSSMHGASSISAPAKASVERDQAP